MVMRETESQNRAICRKSYFVIVVRDRHHRQL